MLLWTFSRNISSPHVERFPLVTKPIIFLSCKGTSVDKFFEAVELIARVKAQYQLKLRKS